MDLPKIPVKQSRVITDQVKPTRQMKQSNFRFKNMNNLSKNM